MKNICSFLVVISIGGSLFGQARTAYSELGIGIGTLNQKSEIANTTSAGALLAEVRPNFSAFAERHFNDWFALGIMASYGWTVANDENHNNQTRGLSVKTDMFQVNPFVEVNLIKFGKYHLDRKFTIYLRGGAGFLAYNPTPNAAKTYPDEFDVEPDAYSGVNFFAGTGVKFRVSYDYILTLGVQVHNSGADNLDGIMNKTPGLQGKNDSYGGINISFSKALF
ncbi:DUF6089 family protein [Owenweeksia hongkongensis]|uniref:DUF6089 family protein n=1 Tax=Owenweeksia hongkongensis TaxID=253245 RepID=UPI003A8D32A4